MRILTEDPDVITRGGVEDKRLEAKDTKNPRPRTAPPRTDTLEAKDRNARGQGHKHKFSPQKKDLQKFFSGDLQKKRSSKNFFRRSLKNGLEKIFSANLQNFNHSKNSAVLEPRKGQFLRT